MSAVRDVYFTYALGVATLGAALGYGVRLATGESPTNERVDATGGTALLGKGLIRWTYWATDPVVRMLVALGITPNGLTWSSLVLGLGAGVALATGWFGLACLLATCSTIGDILDGQVARVTGTGSDRGELLDAAVDRYTEFAFLAGLVVYFRDSIALVVLALAALHASMMISYATAKAEALSVKPPRGLMRRHERGTYLIVGVGLTSLLGDALADVSALPREAPAIAALAIVAVVANVAAIVRFARISRALR